MFHMRKLSNTLSTPVAFSSSSNCISSTPTTKPLETSTKPSHRRGRPSIDKSQVSKPFPILSYDERDLFDAIASGEVQTKPRRIPKAAEKKVKIDAQKLIKPSPQPKPKASVDTSSRSWYTPAPPQPSTTDARQRSVSNATPRATPPKISVTRANSTKEPRGHGRTESEGRRDGVGSTKRRVPRHLITHPDCPWVELTNNPAQHRPVRSETTGSYESDKTAVENEAPTRAEAKREEKATPLVKSAQESFRPMARPVSKPLPDLPIPDSVASKWSASTDSVCSNDDPFSYDKVLRMFPKPPEGIPNRNRLNDLGSSNSLSTPPVFMSCPNTSSSSIATITPATALNSSVKPPTLKIVPKPKVATVVRQIPRASCSYQLQDSIVTRNGRAYPHGSMKGSIHTSSIRTTGAAPSRSQSPPKRVANLEALLWPHRRQTPEDIKRIERERLERERKYQIEQQKEQERKQFEMEFGYNPQYKGKRMYEREVDPDGFELIRHEKEKRRKWL